jgi:hypothetical protein
MVCLTYYVLSLLIVQFGKTWFKPYQASDLRRKIKELLFDMFLEEASRAKERTETIEVIPDNLESKCTAQ